MATPLTDVWVAPSRLIVVGRFDEWPIGDGLGPDSGNRRVDFDAVPVGDMDMRNAAE